MFTHLKSSTNRGRDAYPITLTNAFDLLVKESGEYDIVRQSNRILRGQGGRGGGGRHNFCLCSVEIEDKTENILFL